MSRITVEVKVGPLDRAAQLRYVPRPNLVRRFRHELRLLIVRMPQLVPALTHLSVLRQNPVHRADRTVVDSLVQKRGPHLGRRLVDEPFAMQCTEDPLALGRVEGSLRPRTALRLGRHRSASTIQRGTRHAQRLASFRRLSNPTRQPLGRHDQSFSSSSIGFRGIPRSSEAFFGSLASFPPEPAGAGVGRSRARAPCSVEPLPSPSDLAFSTSIPPWRSRPVADANSIDAMSTVPRDVEAPPHHRHPCRRPPRERSAACIQR